MRLHDKTALITGGTSGIGAETVRLFRREGARVVFTGRRLEQGRQLAQETGAVFVQADHATLEGCQHAVDAALQHLGRLDILFNNAGIVPGGTAEETSEEVWAEVMNVNVTGVWRMSRLVLPLMRSQGGGAIVNNASDFGVVAGHRVAAYCATKGAVVQLTKAMALDHAHEGIRVNAVCPGDTQVERWASPNYRIEGGLEAVVEKMARALPMQRVGTPEEIAKAVLFLASDDSSFMTGAALLVDGGNTAQ